MAKTRTRLRRSTNIKENAQQVTRSARWVMAITWETARGLVIGLAITSIIAGALPAAQAWIIRNVINMLVDASQGKLETFDPILLWLLIGLGATLLQAVASGFSDYFQTILKGRLDLKINVDSLTHTASLDMAQFQDVQFQDTMSRATENMSTRASSFLSSMTSVGIIVLQFISTILILLAIDPIAIVFALPLSLPYMWMQWRFAQMRYKRRYQRATRNRWSAYLSNRFGTADNVPELKIYNLAPLLINRYREVQQELIDDDIAIQRYQFSRGMVFEIIFGVVFTGIFIYQAQRVFNGTFLLGDLVIYNRMAMMLLSLVQRMSLTFSSLIENSLYISNLMTFYETEPTIVKGVGLVPESLEGDIVMRDVSFTYPSTTKRVLKDINLHIEPGETVAIVGENGAGKSTLAMLIARMYDATEGEVLLDGENVKGIDVGFIHQQIAYVTQRSLSYEASVSENIAYGNWETLLDDRKAVEDIAKRVRIHDMIEKMPNGYDTLLGRRFGEYDLSGGQWQRITIARAIARNPKILILDEPTASLDARSEYEIFSHFHDLAEACTTIIISHRFSTVSMADRIIVLDQGEIIETGTHEELMALEGQYAELYRLQQLRMTPQRRVR